MIQQTDDIPANALRVEDVAVLIGKSVPAVWDNLKRVPDFPPPRRAHIPGQGRVTYWIRAEVECFIVKQIDRAWRERKPIHPAFLDPVTLDAARRGAYVLWLLCVPLDEVFPLGKDFTDQGNELLHDFAYGRVKDLLAEAPTVQLGNRGMPKDDVAMRIAQYRRTLDHCDAVMEDRVDPANNGWFDNLADYARGIPFIPPRRKP